jgi:hypothetical protein
MRALNDRVQQLEQELAQSRYAAMPPPQYPMAPPPSYGVPPDYSPAYSACDSDFYDCSSWVGPAYYTIGVPPTWAYRPRRDFDHFHHGHLTHPAGGPHFVGATHFASSGHASGHGSGHSR